MKNYLSFYNHCYYPDGGMNDFIGAFESIDQAKERINKENKSFTKDGNWDRTWGHIYSIVENKIIYKIGVNL